MFLQAWFENEDFREAQASGIFTKSFAALCQMGKYHDLTSLTSKDLIEQLCLRARILDVFINEDATTEYYFNAWFDMFESDSVIIHEQEQDSLKIDINRMLSASELSHIELMAWHGVGHLALAWSSHKIVAQTLWLHSIASNLYLLLQLNICQQFHTKINIGTWTTLVPTISTILYLKRFLMSIKRRMEG
ncbi:hypothetical protein [Aeromonas veronii]|uniref:hypothetical protein n=1 Tax=Aeromonas veronii TaxID=654 RepID=UPI0038B4470A